MDKEIAWIDGWAIRQRCDGSYGVYDDHSLLEGPFGTEGEAIAAALRLPHPAGHKLRPPRLTARPKPVEGTPASQGRSAQA